MFDTVIIGAGVTGAAVARELSRYQLKVCVLEREEDVCCGTSKANSAIIHAGFDAKPGTWKAKLNVAGNRLMDQWSRELDFPFVRNGSMVVCTDAGKMERLEALYQQGLANQVPGLEIITDKKRLREMEPNLSDQTAAVLWAPTGGIVCPFLYNIAAAENAAKNGVEFRFRSEVTGIIKKEWGYEIATKEGLITTRTVVNAAGLYADVLHNMVSERKLQITPRRGSYCLLDKTAGTHVNSTIFMLPGEYGKGVLVTPTVHGNLLMGPTAVDVKDKEAINTTAEELAEVLEKSSMAVKDIPKRQVITSFAGLRAHEVGRDFVLGEAEDAKGFWDCAGIESPGLSASAAIGCLMAGWVADSLHAKKKEHFHSKRRGIVHPFELPEEQRQELVSQNPAYGVIVCRCEMVTEGEIREAIRRPLGARSLDGIKRRTRAGMGRCQAGFCSPRVMELLAEELGIELTQVTKSGGKSMLVYSDAAQVHLPEANLKWADVLNEG
ncbi:MAG: NAD(P)/FAD-dependent oxidoreductase [Lachnospiraceae bacterium]|nr:NAD(P)/FAD-dependent oxidoreductase [Lachnospiraceae bacterium]